MAKADKLICDLCGEEFRMPAHLARHKAATHVVSTKTSRQKARKATAREPTKDTKKAAAVSTLRDIVGDAVYDVWVAMLKELVPDGRTHRLSVLVASMLAYASRAAWSDDDDLDEGSPAYPFVVASEGVDDEEAFRLLEPMLVRLFKDAKVKYERVSSRGQPYSIIWDAVIEFCRWYNYPWEG